MESERSEVMSGATYEPARPPRNMLIVRLSAMGDIIHTLPAATLLRRAFPDVRLGWLIEERWSELLCTRNFARSGNRTPERPLVDHLHTANIADWRRALLSSQTWQDISSSLRDLREVQYDTVIDCWPVLLVRRTSSEVPNHAKRPHACFTQKRFRKVVRMLSSKR